MVQEIMGVTLLDSLQQNKATDWNHSKISYRNWIITKIVIWTNLNAQSVCTYQIWILLIL
jgi:hypothetical protein